MGLYCIIVANTSVGSYVHDRLWNTMAKQGISQYRLGTLGIGHATLSRLKNNQPVNTETIDKLCAILDCKIEDIAEYKP